MKGYQITTWDMKIEEIEIDKTTDHFYFINGKRISKSSTSEFIGETIEEAKQKYIDQINKEISNLERRINYRKSDIQKIQSL